ncbi:DUF559 domain-containing protein [Demequina flava]|uniref:DUF559 domain-containing protein n=1 Tax=Demequina flava TaxID=1095025 RepID=UPI00128DA911|nr:DUF559 domain-containing protein [Demequina flava]
MRILTDLTPVSGSLPDFVAANAHSFTREELLRHWSRRQLDAGIRAETVTRLLTGVYCGTTHATDPVVLGEALTLWQPRGYVTGVAALHLHAPSLPPPTTYDLVVPDGHRLTAPNWVRVRQTGRVTLATAPCGVRCVAPARALLDAWRYAAPAARRPILWEALWTRVCTWKQLHGELERTPRVSGRRDLGRILAWFGEGATSPLEVRAKHETFADARFREFEWQASVTLPTRRLRPDMLHRRAMVAVELDGDRYHSTRAARDADRERRTNLTAAGYAVLGFGWRDVVNRPEWCRERVLKTVAGRFSPPGRS